MSFLTLLFVAIFMITLKVTFWVSARVARERQDRLRVLYEQAEKVLVIAVQQVQAKKLERARHEGEMGRLRKGLVLVFCAGLGVAVVLLRMRRRTRT